MARVGEEEATVIAMKSRVGGGPTPDGDEEELEDVVIADGVGRGGATKAEAGVSLEDLSYLLADPAEEEEEHAAEQEA